MIPLSSASATRTRPVPIQKTTTNPPSIRNKIKKILDINEAEHTTYRASRFFTSLVVPEQNAKGKKKEREETKMHTKTTVVHRIE